MSNTEQLVEIKKGQVGRGLLIEHDGHIYDNNDIVKQIHEDINNNHKFVIPEHFVVSAVFQKYDVKNANGRIYPERILKREVEKYFEKINNRNALGSLDHPNCQLGDTKILTETGWKMIKEVEVGDNVLTINENKEIKIKPILRKIDEEYKGKLIHLKSKNIDISVTPNHRFPLLDRYGKWKGFYTAQEILENKVPDQSHCKFFKTGEWHNISDEFFIVNGLSLKEVENLPSKEMQEKYMQDIKIPMKIWMKFMGIYLSEGNSSYIMKNGYRNGRVQITQKKQENVSVIEEMLNYFPLEYHKNIDKNNTAYFNIYDLRLAKYLYQFGDCYNKYVPYEIKKQGKDMLKIFYDWFVMGDGRKRGINNNKMYSDDVFSTSECLIMDLNEIQLKIGYSGSYHIEDINKDRLIEGRIIKGENSHAMHFSMRTHNENISLSKKYLKVYEEEYKGRVYCIEVENHTFYTMSNGKCLWSGNSSSLSGHDISHNILNLEWKGKTLIGEMELHLSPGYIRYGVCSTSGDLVANMLLSNYLIGVSSRGVGSVENKLNTYIVGDDFDLICWDVVIENSTPGAVIRNTKEELIPFMESKENNMNENKIEKIFKILNE